MNTKNDITPEFKVKCEEHYSTMADNTQVNDEGNQLKFVKMNMPAEHMDFIMDYYHLPNLVEVNRVAIYVLKTLAHMEKDGYKFGMYKTKMQDGKEVLSTEDSFALSVSDMIGDIMKHLDAKQ